MAFLLTFLITGTQNTIPDFDVSLRFLANEIFQVFFSFILTSCHFKITLIQIKKMRIVRHFVETIEKQNFSVYNFSLSGAFY